MSDPKNTPKPASPKGAEAPVIFRTAQKSTLLFDIIVKGEWMYGQWDEKQEHVKFVVPAELAADIKRQYHFTSGLIVEVEADKPAE